MNHDERMQIAKDFTDKVVKKYGKEIVMVAIAGPVAEDEDREFNDLDLMIVTKTNFMQPYHYMYKDCVVEPTYISEEDIPKVARTPLGINGGPMDKADVTFLNNRNWLRWAYLFATSEKVLYGSDQPIKKFNEMTAAISKERCLAQARHELPYVRASINHIRGGSTPTGHVVEFTKLLYEVVAMLNQTFYQSHSQFEESKKFKVLPKGFHDNLKKLQNYSTLSTAELDKTMMALHDSIYETCEQQGAGVEYYDTLSNMKV